MSEPAELFTTRSESQGQPISPAGQALPGAPPAHIGRYRVERLLGKGGFGRVYLAHDDDLQRRVAIKVPHPHRVTEPADVEAYLAEARVLASLEHPHIVPVFDLGRTDDGLCFVVSKFIDGSDLAERIKEGCPPFAESAVLLTAVAEALHHAHKRGLVHRDVKPANILLDPAGTPYLADFGLALKEEDFGKARALAGTPAYMSPEQANGEGHRIDGRSDIFSLGVVLYELLTGQRPFRSALGKEQKAFVEQAIRGLAHEGKVICVRLALFAEMMKARAWTPAALAEVGGTAGVGATFLEDTFSAGTAPPVHRYHQKAVRAVLKALLPEAGTDIKGHMRAHADLLAVSGYAGRPKEFDDLLRILDSEVRLITPTDPEGVLTEPGASATGDGSGPPVADAPGSARGDAPGTQRRYYQLTHDYLVPSLRDWLTRKQKETRRGRAELLLADRAVVWNARPEKRQLPSLFQWLQIRWLTRRKQWTPPQRKMMRKATRHHLARGLLAAAVVLLLGLAGRESYGRLQAQHLRDRLLEANTADVPGVVAEMAPYRRWVNPLLHETSAQADRDNDDRAQLRASLALAPVDRGQVEYLYAQLLKADAEEVTVIRRELQPYKAELSERLWGVLEKPEADLDQRVRAACALAEYTPDDPRWPQVSGDVAARLVIQNAFTLGKWAEALLPVGSALLPPLASFLEDEKRNGSERSAIATLYNLLAAGQPDAFTRLESVLAEQGKPDASAEDKVALAKRQANIGVALVLMGRGDKVWPLLRHSPDPTRRSFLIDRLARGGVDAKLLSERFEQEQDVSLKRALLLSLGEFGPDRLPEVERKNYLPRLLHIYREDPDPGLHAVAAWLLHEWQADGDLRGIDKELGSRERQRPEGRRWYVNGQRQTMVILSPGEFDVGEGPERKHERIDTPFALAARDVTVTEFRRFRKDHQAYAQTEDCPVDRVSWYDAAAYCNWLSAQEGIAEGQWCYPKDIGVAGVSVGPVHLILETLGAQGLAPAGAPAGPLARQLAALAAMDADGFTLGHRLRMPKDYPQRRGYRLPTEAEWEYACRAGSATGWSMGEAEELLPKYAWYLVNSGSRSHPVGWLRPTDLGLFDMHGNVWQWCQDKGVVEDKEPEEIVVNAGGGRVLRGGSWSGNAWSCRTAVRGRSAPGNRYDFIGFRVACSAAPRTR